MTLATCHPECFHSGQTALFDVKGTGVLQYGPQGSDNETEAPMVSKNPSLSVVPMIGGLMFGGLLDPV